MANFISEDDIEQAILKRLEGKGYNIIKCPVSPNNMDDLKDGTDRSSKKQCILPQILLKSLRRLNKDIPDDKITEVYKTLTKDYTGTDLTETNYSLYNKIRNMVPVSFRKDGHQDNGFVKLIDFDNPENNEFTAVSQMWIKGKIYYHRPDVMLFVNGLPLVFIELKNSIVKVEEAYKGNLHRYLGDAPNLFAFNQICVLSNGLETRLGAFNAPYDFFFEWLKVKSEKEILNRQELKQVKSAGESSIKYLIDGLFVKENLIDYIENFIIFENQKTKLIAKNHQYLGVNELIERVKNREELQGKLGVFWHTQGSGKSYSMVFFTRKVRRKIVGTFTFLIITDREDLDTQIHNNFVRTEVLGKSIPSQPKDSKQLREFLQTDMSFIFTLIHKFNYDRTKKYPVLSERNDIIVLVDEAHRTQYQHLAENMRTALPNANFIAFTGTPLLGAKRLTNQWFGDYASEYNFAQAVEDGSTVPLFYSRRVPEVWLKNDFLDDDIVEIIEDENLTEEEQKKLEDSTSQIIEIIKRDDRLDKVAQDIAHHFPRRGFLGKGLVVSVDKFTTVKMYDKVQFYWEQEKKKVIQERNEAKTKEERDNLKNILDYMNNVEMAVVVSEEADEVEKFKKQGLDITKHRNKMNEITPEGANIEDRFKNPKDKLQLVFVCAMWLTGFDVKNLSTVYLDKPMKGHTLMQAIARANRVYPGKTSGMIVDYVNVFKLMKEALSDYATGTDSGVEMPAKDVNKLIEQINESISTADVTLKEIGIDLDKVITETDALDNLDNYRDMYNTILTNGDYKEKIKVILNALDNLYQSAKPEIFEKGWENKKFRPLDYLHKLFNNLVDDEKIERAKRRMAELLDSSILTQQELKDKTQFAIYQSKVIDISKIDIDELRNELKHAEYRAVEIGDLEEYIKEKLELMVNQNSTRTAFSERFKNLINRYNAGGSENEDYYEKLLQLLEDMKKENTRANIEGLSEEELELYDLLVKDKKLTKAEEQAVKLASKNLFNKLSAEKSELFVVDWYKDEQPYAVVKSEIQKVLDKDLPNCYDVDIFNTKVDLLLNRFVDMSVQNIGWLSDKGFISYNPSYLKAAETSHEFRV